MTPSPRRSVWNWLFLISTFSLSAMSGVLLWREILPEWAGVQMHYNHRLSEVTGDRSKAWALPKINQIHLPEMKRTDRCLTCHAGTSRVMQRAIVDFGATLAKRTGRCVVPRWETD